jgi:hypothetical protein
MGGVYLKKEPALIFKFKIEVIIILSVTSLFSIKTNLSFYDGRESTRKNERGIRRE